MCAPSVRVTDIFVKTVKGDQRITRTFNQVVSRKFADMRSVYDYYYYEHNRRKAG